MDSANHLFETERLIVRNLQLCDLDGFHKMQSDPQVLLYANGVASSLEENRAELQRLIDLYDDPDNDFWIWAVVEKSGDKFAGTCALVPDTTPNAPPNQEIGFRFIRDTWGKGFGKEAALGLIQYCIDIRNVPSLVAYVDARNLASVKILKSSPLDFVEQRKDQHGDDELVFRWERAESPVH